MAVRSPKTIEISQRVTEVLEVLFEHHSPGGFHVVFGSRRPAYCRLMEDAKRRYTDDVPDEVRIRVRELCLRLPDSYEERAWVGSRWMVRKRTFAHVLGVEIDGAEPIVVLSFRSAGEELEALRHAGHPFFVLGWGRDAMGMVLDDPDWDEVGELVTESFCVLAPRKLASLVERPTAIEPKRPDRRII